MNDDLDSPRLASRAAVMETVGLLGTIVFAVPLIFLGLIAASDPVELIGGLAQGLALSLLPVALLIVSLFVGMLLGGRRARANRVTSLGCPNPKSDD